MDYILPIRPIVRNFITIPFRELSTLAMESRRNYSHHLLSTDPQRRSKEDGKKEQRKDWGYTNQYRRMMQRRSEQNREIHTEE
ncbi:hypothetical protein [Salinimicrobium oceani]|uniref:Uncharacterized protein n=1 Tax=Salinimicrobium oceani TaxID=2722702 RepID=A0ABX1D0E3_9FLAO|nr:hypothetical protein [Salinimicrobium oceani]NJW53760.1 hypothetical protein [Salinimicrobium oceani]